jgi:hypothetical protein
LIITSGPDCDGSRLYNSLTKPCEELLRPTVYPDGGFLSFLPAVSDDKHAIFVEENVKAYNIIHFYTILYASPYYSILQ